MGVCLYAKLCRSWYMYASPHPFRSRSHSSNSSFEDDFGVRKEVLLHGTYDDYIKEYKSRSAMGSSSKAPANMADIAAAYQKALSQVASALQQQGSSSKVQSFMEQFSHVRPQAFCSLASSPLNLRRSGCKSTWVQLSWPYSHGCVCTRL